ncbi:putative deacetoxyvindoline 4-hydroxylase [Helianthus annuus]|nr:putative deacetoxyvindoline 4-hydroxylase [Helianthus annuus]KAJ0815076.1 putative deacetoxyvindoline 4-hydroxylase [Helianthus annuus]
MAPVTTEQDYDRLTEVKQFDESKIGVKGLLDSGITTIPRFFHHPPENLPGPKPKNRPRLTIPVIDLSGDRSTVVEQIRQSASTLGFFHIINHSIPVTLIDSAVGSVKEFFEQPNEYKMRFYHREAGKGAAYSTNFDLYQSKAASWRDTLQVRISPVEPDWNAVPEMCRAALAEWDKAVVGLGEELMSILCDGMGVKSDKLKELSCLEGRACVSHYYPPCPQPELTVGIASHTDPGVLTVLVQNEVGGLLQVKCGDDWADVEAVHGAIIINIGDLLQMMSNDEYKSVEHRVLANPAQGARVSIAVFFNPSNREKLYGPFPELISTTKPAVYQEFKYDDYMRRFFTKELDGKTLTNFYKIDNIKE